MSEPRSLRGIPAEFCRHDGDIVFTSDSVPRCGDCHTPMMWMPVSHVEAMQAAIERLSGENADLRRRL